MTRLSCDVTPKNPNTDFGGFSMSKYNFELRYEIVKEKERGFGSHYLSDKYPINKSTIKIGVLNIKLWRLRYPSKSI